MDITIKQSQRNFTLRAAALIIDSGRLLAVKSDGYDAYYTVGGKVRIGESTAEAVVREAFEETGYRFEIERLLFINEGFFSVGDCAHHEVCFSYLMKPNSTIICGGENTDLQTEHLVWLPIRDLPRLPLVPVFLRTALQNLPEQPIHLISKT